MPKKAAGEGGSQGQLCDRETDQKARVLKREKGPKKQAETDAVFEVQKKMFFKK